MNGEICMKCGCLLSKYSYNCPCCGFSNSYLPQNNDHGSEIGFCDDSVIVANSPEAMETNVLISQNIVIPVQIPRDDIEEHIIFIKNYERIQSIVRNNNMGKYIFSGLASFIVAMVAALFLGVGSIMFIGGMCCEINKLPYIIGSVIIGGIGFLTAKEAYRCNDLWLSPQLRFHKKQYNISKKIIERFMKGQGIV